MAAQRAVASDLVEQWVDEADVAAPVEPLTLVDQCEAA
jgi:hypothetical protein